MSEVLLVALKLDFRPDIAGGTMLKKDAPFVGSFTDANPPTCPPAGTDALIGVEGRSSPNAPLRFVGVLLIARRFSAEDRSLEVSLKSGCLRIFGNDRRICIASCSAFRAELAISAVDIVCGDKCDLLSPDGLVDALCEPLSFCLFKRDSRFTRLDRSCRIWVSCCNLSSFESND